MTRLICLANSWRPGGRCIAGIDAESGEWVRPVPPGGGPIAEGRTRVAGRLLLPLDVVEIELAPPTYSTRFQRENRVVLNWKWRLLGQVTPSEVLRYCSKGRTVLHSSGKVVEPAYMARLPPKDWASLDLVRATNVSFVPDPRKENRWQVSFSMVRFSRKYCLTLTDPEATRRLEGGGQVRSECLLTVSLTEPIAMHGMPGLCYKLVVAVIEL